MAERARGHIAGMFWRARRLYEGVLLLLKAELPAEAAILARSLCKAASILPTGPVLGCQVRS